MRCAAAHSGPGFLPLKASREPTPRWKGTPPVPRRATAVLSSTPRVFSKVAACLALESSSASIIRSIRTSVLPASPWPWGARSSSSAARSPTTALMRPSPASPRTPPGTPCAFPGRCPRGLRATPGASMCSTSPRGQLAVGPHGPSRSPAPPRPHHPQPWPGAGRLRAAPRGRSRGPGTPELEVPAVPWRLPALGGAPVPAPLGPDRPPQPHGPRLRARAPGHPRRPHRPHSPRPARALPRAPSSRALRGRPPAPGLRGLVDPAQGPGGRCRCGLGPCSSRAWPSRSPCWAPVPRRRRCSRPSRLPCASASASCRATATRSCRACCASRRCCSFPATPRAMAWRSSRPWPVGSRPSRRPWAWRPKSCAMARQDGCCPSATCRDSPPPWAPSPRTGTGCSRCGGRRRSPYRG